MTKYIWQTLIKGGLVFDGSGQHPKIEDIAIANGKVAMRGRNLDETLAETVVDAKNQWVMPGFLDIHTHLDLEIELAPGLEEVVRHGTTSVLIANCSLGLTFGSQRKNGEDPIVDCFARVENIPKHVLSAAADQINWTSSSGYYKHLDEIPTGPNIIPMIPHSMLRVEVMGLKGSVSRQPNDLELKQMADLVEQGMKQGYIGMSTDALPFHYLSNDPNRKVRIPSQWCSWKELKTLTDVVRRYDRVWQATPAKDNPLEVVKSFALTSGRLFGKPLKVTAVAVMDMATHSGLVGMSKTLNNLLNSWILKGNFYFQVLAAPFKVYWDGPVNPLAEEIPVLRELNELDLEDTEGRRDLLANEEYKKRFRKMWMHGKKGLNAANLFRKLNREDISFSRKLNEMEIYSGGCEEWKNETMADLQSRVIQWKKYGTSARSKKEEQHFSKFPLTSHDEVDFILHIFAEYDLELRWTYVSANRDKKVTEDLLFDERFLPGFNDSGAHLTNLAFNDANLCGLQMAQSRGVAQVSRLVRRLTQVPADFLGIDAGRIEVDSQADVIIIDPYALASYDSESNTKFIWREDISNEQIVKRSDGVVTHSWIAGNLAWSSKHGASKDLGIKKFGRAIRANKN